MKKLRISIILLILLGLNQVKAQTTVKSLDASTISQIPLNRFFIYSADSNLNSNQSFACVKTNVDIETLGKLLDNYHGVEAKNSADEFGVPTKIWEAVARPVRHKKLHDVEMKIYRQEDYYLLTFTTSTKSLKTSSQNKQSFQRGVTLQEVDYLQTNLNHLLFNSPLQSAFYYGSNTNHFYLSVEEQRQMKLSDIFLIYQLSEQQKDESNEVYHLAKHTLHGDSVKSEMASVLGYPDYDFDLKHLTKEVKYSSHETYTFINSMLSKYTSSGTPFSRFYSINRFSDTLSMTYRPAYIAPWSHVDSYTSLNYFNKDHQLDYQVSFVMDTTIDFLAHSQLLPLHNTLSRTSSRADTLNYVYGEHGQLLYINPTSFQMARHCQERNYPIQQIERPAPDLQKSYGFYQLYVGDVKMEAYFNNYLGYTPNSIFLELYKYGAFIFKMDPIGGKYYMDETLILE